MLGYVERWFGSIVRPTLPILPYHIFEAGIGTHVLHNLVDDIGIVGTVTAFFVVVSRVGSCSLMTLASVVLLSTQ